MTEQALPPQEESSPGPKPASAHQQAKQEWLTQPIPAEVLKRLLSTLNIPVQTGKLVKACAQAQQEAGEITPSQRVGLILKALKLDGIQAAQLRWIHFDQRRLPALLFFEGQWQFIERGADRTLTLINTAGESRQISAEDLEDSLVLWLRTAPKREQISVLSKDNIAARIVLREVFKSRRWVVDVLIATVIVNLLAVATSIFAMQVYDRVVPTLAYATLTTLVVGMGIIVSLDWLLKTVRARTLDAVSSEVDKTTSQQVFDHVMNLRLDSRPRSLGTLAAQVGGLDSVRQFFTSGVIFALIDMPFALMFIAFIWVIAGPVALVYAILLPVAAALGWLTQKRLRRLLKEQVMRSNERQGLLVDAIQGTESIRANNANWRFSESWQDITKTISQYNIQQKAISNRTTTTTASLSTIAYVSAIVVGVGQIEAGNLTMGGLIAASILGGRIIAPIAQSVQHLVQWQNVSQALHMVNQVLALDTERQPGQNLLMPDQKPERVMLKGVTFSYPASPVKQLDIPSLTLNAGERVVLLGAVGSGKSTLLKVMAGLYRPAEGRVRLGQADLWEMEPSVVADQVGYLPQSVHLFKGTLRSNLALSGAVSDSHLLQVSQELGIDQFAADRPQGMELEISEGGEGLSGGQRQLVGMARILLAQPTLWLLDEPTASLDVDSERRVLEAISQHVKPDDILVISTHRPALAAQLASRVILMERGSIKADGKPEVVMPKIMRKAPPAGASPSGKAGVSGADIHRGRGHVI